MVDSQRVIPTSHCDVTGMMVKKMWGIIPKRPHDYRYYQISKLFLASIYVQGDLAKLDGWLFILILQFLCKSLGLPPGFATSSTKDLPSGKLK